MFHVNPGLKTNRSAHLSSEASLSIAKGEAIATLGPRHGDPALQCFAFSSIYPLKDSQLRGKQRPNFRFEGQPDTGPQQLPKCLSECLAGARSRFFSLGHFINCASLIGRRMLDWTKTGYRILGRSDSVWG